MNDNMKKNACMHDDDFQSYLDRQMSLPDRVHFEKHMKECRKCRRKLESFTGLFNALDSKFACESVTTTIQDRINEIMNLITGNRIEHSESLLRKFSELFFSYKSLLLTAATALFIIAAFRFIPSGDIEPGRTVIPTGNDTFASAFEYQLIGTECSILKDLTNRIDCINPNGELRTDDKYSLSEGARLIIKNKRGSQAEIIGKAEFSTDERSISLFSGAVSLDLASEDRGFEVITAPVKISTIGTKFFVATAQDHIYIKLTEGRISIKTAVSNQVLSDQGERYVSYDGAIRENLLSNTDLQPIQGHQPGVSPDTIDDAF